MRKILFFLFLTSCTLLTASLWAQTYPVQGSAFLIPPYSLRLSDYATSTSERLAMNVLLTDVTRAELRVRFRLHIEGPTISIDSKAEYIGNPVTLQGGVSLRLTNLDLSEYFNLQNIYFTGISEREFLQKGTLPEGLYRICFDVLEYNRGVKISQSICAQAFFVLNDPPIINLPRQGETLRAQMPQNVIMQWTPRHTGSPNSAFNTQYEIKVVEVWPADRNANDAILTQPAIYETTTANTSLIYGPDATQLEPGRTYAFRVRAVPMGVADQLDLFKNNGYSETVSFVYGQACKPSATVTGKVTGPHTLTLDWTQDSNHTAYKVHFRKQGSHDWRLQRASINTADLKDLEANTNYEYEVGAVCGDFESLYSPIGELKTMEAQTPLYECGAQPKGTLNTNQEPLPELKVGDKVHTLTVEVTITKVTGGNGTFSGEAEARMKIFNNALMRLTYKDIRVNKDYWLIGGYFEAVSGGVDLPGDTREGLDVLGDILSESQGGGTSNDYKAPPPDTTTFVAQETITIPDGIQSITKDKKTGLVTVTDTKGVKHDLPQGKDVAVVDENGRGALVDKQGQITNTTAEQAKAAGKREYGFSMVFEKATESKAGFDKYDGKTTALKNTYQKIEEYIVAWKAVGTGTDVVKGNLNFGTARDLLFEQEGARLTYNEFTNILTVNPVSTGSTAQVIVKEKVGGKEKIRGKLNVAGYASMSKTVHIVPVNNATCTLSNADLKKYLDDVYGQALVSWQVDIKNKIEVPFTGDFDDGGSGLLSTYTGDMRKVIKAYGRMEQEHYYIFLIERGKTKTGYMPRGKRAGFVFLNSQNGEELKHTIAHELGHGAFTLRHPFAEYPAVTAKSTDNLMDYAGGTHLYKWQWDQIHNPVLVIGLFEGDSEGEKDRVEIKIVCSISDKTVADGKVLIKNDTSRTVKLKYDIADITKTKVTYKIEMDSANTKMTYPKTGVDTLLFNVEKTLLLDSLPQGKYTITCYNKKKVMTLKFFIRKKKLEITREQLKNIFPSATDARRDEVARAINKYSEQFDIGTPQRMGHFLGQIGAETGGLMKLQEDFSYSPRGIVKTFSYPKYGHLFEEAILNPATYEYSYNPINYDENQCNGDEISRGNATFSFERDAEIRNAYAEIKSDSLVTKNGKKTKVLIYKTRTDITKDNIEGKVDKNYNEGRLKVKNKYINSSALFDVTYACRMGNGDVSSKNGSTFLGKGFIHITGKDEFEAISTEWNDLYPKDPKQFHGQDIKLLGTDPEIALKVSMIYWKLKKLNQKADTGIDQTTIDNIGKIVNGSGKELPNGYQKRRDYSTATFKNIK